MMATIAPQLAAVRPLRTPGRRRPAAGQAAALRERAVAKPYGFVQAKLTVGAVNDPLEHEADAAADHVMRMDDPDLAIAPAPPRLTRKCDACDDDQKSVVQAMRRDTVLADGGEAPEGIEAFLDAPGRPLDPADRAFFEPRFGRDLSRVRVHTDSEAAQANRRLSAQAFTFGPHIFFAAGNAPGQDFLTGHELAHVAQQGAAPTLDGASRPPRLVAPSAQRWIQRLPGDGMSPPGDCSWSTYIPLRISKETAVAVAEGLGGCMPGDSCPRLAFKIAALSAEIAARVAIAAACFRGGDTGHVEQIRLKTIAFNNCLDLFRRSNCSPELIAEMNFVVERIRALLATLFVVAAIVVVVALIVLLIEAIIALIEAIVLVIAAAIVAVAEAYVIVPAAAALIAILSALRDDLASGDSEA